MAKTCRRDFGNDGVTYRAQSTVVDKVEADEKPSHAKVDVSVDVETEGTNDEEYKTHASHTADVDRPTSENTEHCIGQHWWRVAKKDSHPHENKVPMINIEFEAVLSEKDNLVLIPAVWRNWTP